QGADRVGVVGVHAPRTRDPARGALGQSCRRRGPRPIGPAAPAPLNARPFSGRIIRQVLGQQDQSGYDYASLSSPVSSLQTGSPASTATPLRYNASASACFPLTSSKAACASAKCTWQADKHSTGFGKPPATHLPRD